MLFSIAHQCLAIMQGSHVTLVGPPSDLFKLLLACLSPLGAPSHEMMQVGRKDAHMAVAGGLLLACSALRVRISDVQNPQLLDNVLASH